MNFRSLAFIVLSIIFALSWAAGFWNVQPFDFDESFYRRIAEEMIVSKNFLWTTYQFAMDSNKPTGFIWLLAAAHALFDQDPTHLSAAAARGVSLFFTYSTVLLTWWIASQQRLVANLSRAKLLFFVICLFCCLWFPTIGAGAVLIDPALTFFSTLAIYNLEQLLFCNRGSAKIAQTILYAGAMFFSCLLKGPIGILLPGAFVLLRFIFLRLSRRGAVSSSQSSAEIPDAKTMVLNIWKPFFLGFLLLISYYVVLWNFGAKEYVYDFLVTHNFKRAVSAREGHSGSVFYYFGVVLLGGAPLLGLWFSHLIKTLRFKPLLANAWFVWMLTLLLFYSLVKTKLPNYIWPIWPAFVLCFMGTVSFDKVKTDDLETSYWYSKILVFLFGVCVVVSVGLGIAFFVFPRALQSVGNFAIDRRALVVIESLGRLPFLVEISFYLLGLLFLCTGLILIFYKRFSYRTLVGHASVGVLINLVVKLGVLPFADHVLNGSVMRLTTVARALNPSLLAVVGMQSPTVDSFYLGGKVENFSAKSDEPFQQLNTVVLTPVWNRESCTSHGFKIVATDFHMALCSRHRP